MYKITTISISRKLKIGLFMYKKILTVLSVVLTKNILGFYKFILCAKYFNLPFKELVINSFNILIKFIS